MFFDGAKMVVALLIVALVLLFGVPRVKLFLKTRAERMDIESRYKLLLKSRDEMIYFTDWAKERGDTKEAKNMKLEVERIETEMAGLSDRYDSLDRLKQK